MAKKLRFAIQVTLCIALGISSRWAQSEEPVDLTATVAGWNIERQDGGSSRVKAIAEGIKALDAEVIVLTEVQPHSRLDDLMDELDALGAKYDKSMPTQGQHKLGIAVLFKNGVEVEDVQLIGGSDLGDSDGFRKALSAKVKIGTFDFLLIGVHLKSGRSDGSRDDRTEQAEVIADFVKNETMGAEKDVIIVGDYNMIPPTNDDEKDKSNFEAMNPDNFLRFISADFLGRFGTHLRSDGSFGNHLDGYAISRSHTREFVGGSLRIFPLWTALRRSRAKFVQEVSDHAPLVARFDVASEDDD